MSNMRCYRSWRSRYGTPRERRPAWLDNYWHAAAALDEPECCCANERRQKTSDLRDSSRPPAINFKGRKTLKGARGFWNESLLAPERKISEARKNSNNEVFGTVYTQGKTAEVLVHVFRGRKGGVGSSQLRATANRHSRPGTQALSHKLQAFLPVGDAIAVHVATDAAAA